MLRKLFIIVLIPMITGIYFNMFNPLSAQVVEGGYHDKLSNYYEEGHYLDCAFKADRMLMKSKYKKDPEVYLYLAISKHQIYLLSIKDPQILLDNKEHKNAYDDALRNADYAKKRDRRVGEFFPNNDHLLKEIVYSGLPICEQYIAEERYTKALSYYRKFLKIIDNHHILFMKGVMDMYNNDAYNANEVFKEVFEALRTKTLTKDSNTEHLMPQGFNMYYDYLMKTDSIYYADSAYNVLKFGTKHFPKNPDILLRLENHKLQTDTITE